MCSGPSSEPGGGASPPVGFVAKLVAPDVAGPDVAGPDKVGPGGSGACGTGVARAATVASEASTVTSPNPVSLASTVASRAGLVSCRRAGEHRTADGTAVRKRWCRLSRRPGTGHQWLRTKGELIMEPACEPAKPDRPAAYPSEAGAQLIRATAGAERRRARLRAVYAANSTATLRNQALLAGLAEQAQHGLAARARRSRASDRSRTSRRTCRCCARSRPRPNCIAYVTASSR